MRGASRQADCGHLHGIIAIWGLLDGWLIGVRAFLHERTYARTYTHTLIYINHRYTTDREINGRSRIEMRSGTDTIGLTREALGGWITSILRVI